MSRRSAWRWARRIPGETGRQGGAARAIRRYIGPGSNGPAKVLVVDDEAGTRELLKEMLESDGYIPVLAANGKEALEACWRRSR
jgi:PleD family two-component response regulator